MAPINLEQSWLAAASALGAILSAGVAWFAAISGPRTQVRIARNHHVTESRRAWQADVRSAVATFVVAISRLRRLQRDTPMDIGAVSEAIDDVQRSSAMLRLLLDPKKPSHQRLDNTLTAAFAATTTPGSDNKHYAVGVTEVQNAASEILEEAWTRIKRGD